MIAVIPAIRFDACLARAVNASTLLPCCCSHGSCAYGFDYGNRLRNSPEEWYRARGAGTAANHDIGSGAGAGVSGSGMNSWSSRSGSFMRPARQSALACSMRSLCEETKFQSM